MVADSLAWTLCTSTTRTKGEKNHSQVVNFGLTGGHESCSTLEKDNLKHVQLLGQCDGGGQPLQTMQLYIK